MNHRWLKYGVVTVTASAILFSSNPVIIPQTAQAAAVQKSISSQYVRLNSTSVLSVRDAHFLMQEKGKVLAFNVYITNNSSRPLNLIDYWIRVKTKNGKVFKATLVESDKEKTFVPAKTTETLTYYAVVDSGTKLSDLQFQAIKWDFSAANYERSLGTISAPSNATDKVGAFKAKTMRFQNTKIRSAVKQAFITEDKSSAYMTINFLLENSGLQAANVSALKFYVQTESMSVYTVNAPDLEQMVIQPKERKIVTLNVTLPKSVARKPLSIVAALNDEASKVQLPLGVYALPSVKPAAALAYGKARTVYMSGQPIRTSVGAAVLTENDDGYGLAIDFKLKNIGSNSIDTPNLEFILHTKGNVSYPLTYSKEENGKLLPNIEKKLELTGQIPDEAQLKDATIELRMGATEKDKGYVIGNYKTVSQSSAPSEGSLSSSFVYDEKYEIKLNSIQRSPLQDSDMLVADITVTNKSNESQKIPNLSGYFMVNGVKVDGDYKTISLDDTITIAPKATFNYAVYTKIPYTTTINSVSFVSTEPVQDKPAKDLYRFTGQKLSEVPAYGVTRAYEITNIGKKASATLLRSVIFEGEKTRHFYSEFVLTNKEARAANIAQLGGYVQDASGQVVPVQFSETSGKLMPGGKILISAWAKLPSQFDISNYKLFIGQGVEAAGTGTPQEGEPAPVAERVIVKPVSYSLSGNGDTGIDTDLKNIALAGHELSLQKIRAQLRVISGFTVEGIDLSTQYTLTQNEEYDVIAGERKIMIEFVNQDSHQVTYSKTFTIDKEAEGQEMLKKGTNVPLTITFADPEVQSKISDYKKYKLNVYEVFQDTKLLIASRELNWFATEE
ncbi:hypothetical protein IJ21_06380 [Paenibacillus sp. 32O-W]|uniref:hypothetical protein n=1 Tax=Paenibacillus sp. 32O-W TaxID=1695218 RepID=UPI0007222AA1|nr:hypothetical protein [Paenibacillus sp. 32O-W]ALS26070.1 hypothetical protein IJ21_06380 [Paenibacillus sp. 32O-W]